MTDKGWICLAVALLLTILVLAMIALWRISSNLTRISKRLDVTNDKLQSIYLTQRLTMSTISGDIKGVSESIHDVYESMFDNAVVSILRDDRKEEDDD